jgi:hypothetical protein
MFPPNAGRICIHYTLFPYFYSLATAISSTPCKQAGAGENLIAARISSTAVSLPHDWQAKVISLRVLSGV